MRLTQPLTVDLSTLPGVIHQVRVPADYEFDGASIPRAVWSVIGAPFEPDFLLAACTHDWYCDQSLAHNDYQSRVIGDSVFFCLLAKSSVPRWKRTAMYLAVRIHSWWHYSAGNHASGVRP